MCLSNTFFPVYSMPSRSSSPTVLDRSTSPLPRTARRCATGFAVRSPPSFASTCVPCERGVSFVSRSCVVAFVVSLPFCPRTPRAFRVVVRLVLDASSRTLSLSRLVSVESRGRILPAIAFATRSALSFSLSFLVLFMARFERCHSHLGPSKSSPQFASHNT